MHQINITSAPIYLPVDVAQLPFGDPLSTISVTSASPGVVTAPGYRNITAGDEVSFSFAAGGSIPTGLTAGTVYYVVNPSGNTFQVSATKGGAAINTSSTGANLTLHLLSQQSYGTRHPFKPGCNAVALNPGTTTLTLQGAPDLTPGTPGSLPADGNPTGPGTYTTIATLAAGTAQLVQLGYDWISLTGAGNLILIQN